MRWTVTFTRQCVPCPPEHVPAYQEAIRTLAQIFLDHVREMQAAQSAAANEQSATGESPAPLAAEEQPAAAQTTDAPSSDRQAGAILSGAPRPAQGTSGVPARRTKRQRRTPAGSTLAAPLDHAGCIAVGNPANSPTP